jgi:hypothetical protein
MLERAKFSRRSFWGLLYPSIPVRLREIEAPRTIARAQMFRFGLTIWLSFYFFIFLAATFYPLYSPLVNDQDADDYAFYFRTLAIIGTFYTSSLLLYYRHRQHVLERTGVFEIKELSDLTNPLISVD